MHNPTKQVKSGSTRQCFCSPWGPSLVPHSRRECRELKCQKAAQYNDFQTWCHAAVNFFSSQEKKEKKNTSWPEKKEKREETEAISVMWSVYMSAFIFHLGLFETSRKHTSLGSARMKNELFSSHANAEAKRFVDAVDDWQGLLNTSRTSMITPVRPPELNAHLYLNNSVRIISVSKAAHLDSKNQHNWFTEEETTCAFKKQPIKNKKNTKGDLIMHPWEETNYQLSWKWRLVWGDFSLKCHWPEDM